MKFDFYEISEVLKRTAKLMELHEGNPFKINALNNAVFHLSKLPSAEMDAAELLKIVGIGKSLAQTIVEIQSTGTSKELNLLLVQSPEGILEMLKVKGLGPKKVRLLWKELELESIGELYYACLENRLVALKGFGKKTQDAVKKEIEFIRSSKGKHLFADVENAAMSFIGSLQKEFATYRFEITGEMHRQCEIISSLEILTDAPADANFNSHSELPFKILHCEKDSFYKTLVQTSSTPQHLEKIAFHTLKENLFKSESAVYEALQLPYFYPEWREGVFEDVILKSYPHDLISDGNLRGTLHNHSRYSDGSNTLREMAEYAKSLGLEYLGICDHSKSAVYASGMTEERVAEQHLEIEKLNKDLYPFKVYKGIESDILFNGDLDYEDEILRSFDFVVASIHQHFKMDEEKATARLIRAIEHPATRILGHPTGRLLLSRMGYPVHHKKIIDACAANGVVIELNANPHRLDLDWRFIPECMEKGVKISINPDAHEIAGYQDMRFGVKVARKGLLTKSYCLNAMDRMEFEQWLKVNK